MPSRIVTKGCVHFHEAAASELIPSRAGKVRSLHSCLQNELEDELVASLASFGVDAKSGRMTDARYFAAHAELERRRAAALAQRPASHAARAAYLHSTILWHINKVRTLHCRAHFDVPCAADKLARSYTKKRPL